MSEKQENTDGVNVLITSSVLLENFLIHQFMGGLHFSLLDEENVQFNIHLKTLTKQEKFGKFRFTGTLCSQVLPDGEVIPKNNTEICTGVFDLNTKEGCLKFTPSEE